MRAWIADYLQFDAADLVEGWLEREYQAYNYPFPSGGMRVSQLEEAVQIMKALWEQEPASLQGQHYSVTDAYCMPHPDPQPPLVIAAWAPRMLRLVARYADWWDIGRVTPDEYRTYMTNMEQACVEVGRDPSTLHRSCWFGLCSCARTEELE